MAGRLLNQRWPAMAHAGIDVVVAILVALLMVSPAPAAGPDTDQTTLPAADRLQGQDDIEEDDDEDEPMAGDLLKETGAPVTADRARFGSDYLMPPGYEGELRLSAMWPTIHEDTFHTTNRLDLKGRQPLGDVNIHVRLKLDYQDLEASGAARADLRELYGEHRINLGESRYVTVSAGKKIISWGKGDEVRPVDRVSPQDLTAFRFYDLSDRKTGRLGAFLDVQFNQRTRFEGFWSPYFETSQIPGTEAYFEPALMREARENGIAIDDDEPAKWSSDTGVGGRLMFSFLKADAALYAFHGYTPDPTYVVSRVGLHPVYGLPIVPLSVTATYPRITFYGADVERTLGPVVVRAEAAYQTEGALFSVDWRHDPSLLLANPDGTVEKRQLEYVLGLDKNDFFIHNLSLNLQFLGSYIFDYDPEIVTSESRSGMSAQLRYACLDSRMELKYRFMAIFSDNDQYHHIEMAYKPLPLVRLALGGAFFEGKDPNGYFGQFDDRDYLYASVKLAF